MESSFLDKQGIIQTTGHVFWTVQFTRNIPKDNEQHIPEAITQRNIGKLYVQFCNTGQDDERIRRKDNLIFEDCREA